MTHPDAEPDYVLGHSASEIRRLITQAEILNPITERLLLEAGLEAGMRVLDVGCGAGDVSMLVGRLLNGSGLVVGIDRSAEVLAAARKRTEATGLRNIEYRQLALEELEQPHAFDLVVGRYVLMHQADIKAFLRAAAGSLRSGGCLGFHEVITRAVSCSTPRVAEYDQAIDLFCAAFRAGVPHHDVADRLAQHFSEAGLPQPELFSETPIGCKSDSALFAWTAETLRSFLPLIRKIDPKGAEAVEIDAIEDRMRTAAQAANAQVMWPAQVCGWTRL